MRRVRAYHSLLASSQARSVRLGPRPPRVRTIEPEKKKKSGLFLPGENSREKNILLPIIAVIRFIDQSGTVLIFLLAILEKKLKGQFFLSSQRKK